jgi:hypothetical protein
MSPLAGSTTTASCAYRPSALTGCGSRIASRSNGSTSNTYPWSRSIPPSPATASVSSQVSQVRHGVTPPAQLVDVPAMPTRSLTRRPWASATTIVQPPAAPGS